MSADQKGIRRVTGPARSGSHGLTLRMTDRRAAMPQRVAFLGVSLWALTSLAGCVDAPEAEGARDVPVERVAQEGRVILITGSTGGLGREVALEMASRGAHIIVHGRNVERGNEVVDAIEEDGVGSAEFHAADLASLDEVRGLAERIRARHDRIDVLVNNAGIWLQPEEGRRMSDDGHELHFQVNYLSHFLLTRELLPLLRAAATRASPARVINVSSAAQRPIDFDDVMMEEGYSDGRGYAQSKLAQIFHTFDLAEELEGEPVLVYALHPASMMDTEMVLARGARARASVDEGREAVVNLITAPGLGSGQYFNGLTPVRANDQAYDEEARERLRTLSLAWIGEG
jgi:NAD(P)-dependent dehydrogenase (short-subunit alcohol dehydrogenase family)